MLVPASICWQRPYWRLVGFKPYIHNFSLKNHTNLKPSWAICPIFAILKIHVLGQILDVSVETILHSAFVWKDSNQVRDSQIWSFQTHESSAPKLSVDYMWIPDGSGHENLQEECVDIDECMDNSHLCVLDSDCLNNEGLGQQLSIFVVTILVKVGGLTGYLAVIVPNESPKIVPRCVAETCP